MSYPLLNTRNASLALLAATTLTAGAADIIQNAGLATPARAVSEFKAVNSHANFYTQDNGRIGRVYGKAFSHGATAAESVDSFVNQHSDMWGIDSSDLLAEGPFDDGRQTQQIYYLPDVDAYKFTGHYFKQMHQGYPVFRSKLVLLTRNEESNPLVLASSDLHDLRSFEIDQQVARAGVNEAAISQQAKTRFGQDAFVNKTPERVVFTGVTGKQHAPTLADVTEVIADGFHPHIMITDARTGEIIHDESMISHIDVAGNVSAMATQGVSSAACETEVPMPLPYLNVNIQGGGSSITDVDGNYTIPHGGSANVTVNTTLDGQWFRVFDNSSSVESLSQVVTPPGPANFMFNESNSGQFTVAQVNAYIGANKTRDFALAANPSYPSLNSGPFDIIVNRTSGLCPSNAWYDGQSINFCASVSSSTPNMAWSVIVEHEYGHHLVAAGGSGQGQYGEGMGDVMGVLLEDDPRSGLGYTSNCNQIIRNADNNMQYPCAGAIHTCGQLISGCIWDTRNMLVATEPDNYIQILRDLAINSILIHSGDLITPQITIDWLTLDDDDANIGNGTPHYFEIDAGFSAHNMDAPALILVDINPIGLPDFVDPNGGTTVAAEFTDISGTLDPATPTLMVDTGSGFQPIAMSNTAGSTYAADIPASDCGSQVQFYFTADTTSGLTQNEPVGAPGSFFSALSAFDAPVVSFEDDFESNQGWSVSGSAANSAAGRWERAIPTGAGNRADPPSDFDGSGRAYVTGNGAPGANNDVDNDSTLTSPAMDASGDSIISYARWFNNAGNDAIDDIFVVEVSDNAGASWSNLETLGVNHPESNGGWFTAQFALSEVAGFTPNDQFMIRFTTDDTGSGSIVECGIDAVSISVIDCDACPADLTGDGALDFFDISEFLTALSSSDPVADFTGDGLFDFFDISAFLTAYADGCP